MTPEMTPLLNAAQARGCRVQVGDRHAVRTDSAYLAFFGFTSTTPEHLRQLAAQGPTSTKLR